MLIVARPGILVRVLSVVFLALLLFGVKPTTFAAPLAPGKGLFTGVPPVRDSRSAVVAPMVRRTRWVIPDFAQLNATGDAPLTDQVTLNLFADVTFSATLDRAVFNPSGSFTWIGHLDNVRYSSVVLVIKENVMMGAIKMPGAFYRVRYAADGVHAIDELDEAAFPNELPPLPVASSDDVALDSPVAPLTDNGSVIDVLVVYTDDARVAVGGTTAMENLIDQAIAETNASYANSNIAQRVNLVHTAEVGYDESNFDWHTTLSRLTSTTDGYMDNVHSLRDAYCADEVVLVVANKASCGIAWMQSYVSPSFASHAFAVVSENCATGYYSFAHEMGHNMGAHHDWYVSSNTTPYSYSHGYVNTTDRWRTIMAYNSECSNQGFSCSRLQYWSNPAITYGGDPMGVPGGTSSACTTGVLNPHCDADNHQALNNTAYTVANFRDSAACNISTYTIGGYARNPSGVGAIGVPADFGGARPSVTTDSSGYYSQSGFANGDYTISFSQAGYFFSPAKDQVTVNSGNATHNAIRYAVVPASIPLSDGFESGSLGSHWAVETDYEGRVRVSSTYPYQGNYSLLLDDATDGSFYSHASAILALDLSGETAVNLSFWWRDFGDEDHTDDGVFISDDDGAMWYKAFSFSGAPHPYSQTVIDVYAVASTVGMSLNDHFLVKFQFYDNDAITADGYGIDNVTVTRGATPGPLSYNNHLIDDDNLGESAGNANRIIDCGETIELYVDLYNEGTGAATGVSATVSSADPYITFTHNITSSYPDIPSASTRRNVDDIEFVVSPAIPHRHTLHFDVAITSATGGPWSDSFALTANCTNYTFIYLPLVVRRN